MVSDEILFSIALIIAFVFSVEKENMSNSTWIFVGWIMGAVIVGNLVKNIVIAAKVTISNCRKKRRDRRESRDND